MSQKLQKVIWLEGMSLEPHHFQQLDRYQESVVNARLRTLFPHHWGVSDLRIDEERLGAGQLAVLECSGVMPDGLLFDVPATDEAPPIRNLQDQFGATRDRLAVYLAVPAIRRDGNNIAVSQNGAARREVRFSSRTIPVMDENTGADEREIEVASANLSVRFGGESMEAYSTLHIADIVRTAAGAFTLDRSFIPPILTLGASKFVVDMCRRLLELLSSRSTSMRERHRNITAQREITPADVTAISLLSTIVRHIPTINHFYSTKQGHPEQLFLALSGLAAELTVHGSSKSRPQDFPVYDHSNLTECFGGINRVLQDVLGVEAPPTNYVQIDLEKRRENMLGAAVDQQLLAGAQFFLVTRSETISEDRLANEFPRMLRIASSETIDAVLRSYTRALPVEHTSRLPAGMPVDNRASYFQLQKHGPFWEAIVESGTIAIFVPSEFEEIDLSLIAVNKS